MAQQEAQRTLNTMKHDLITIVSLYQSFFDRVCVLNKEHQEGQITKERLAERINGLVVEFHKALKGETAS